MFDGSSGKMMCQLYDPGYSGITSVRLGPPNNDGRGGIGESSYLSDQNQSPCTASPQLHPDTLTFIAQ